MNDLMAGIEAKDWLSEHMLTTGDIEVYGESEQGEAALPLSHYLIKTYCPKVLFVNEELKLMGSSGLPRPTTSTLGNPTAIPLEELFDENDIALFQNAVCKVLADGVSVRKYGQVLQAQSHPVRVDLTFRQVHLSQHDSTTKLVAIAIWDSPLAATTVTTSEEQLIADTQLRILNRELRQSNAELSEKNSYLNSFVYGAAHDLRSPLVVLKSYVDLIRRFKDEKKKEQALEYMKTATVRFENVLDGLVKLVELQNTNQSPTESLAFAKVFESVCFILEHEIEKVQPSVDADFSVSPTIEFVKAYLNSILYNLFSNAIKYRRKGVRLKIGLRTLQEKDFVVLEVRDNGIGMNMERYGEQLFEPFRRLTAQESGLGIGLNLVKNMVEKNGGRIEVESELGEGTSFRVFLKPYPVE
ncbi:MAG: HAMP domain-containing sensor histidine kinase [Bacteroidota bacterium]